MNTARVLQNMATGSGFVGASSKALKVAAKRPADESIARIIKVMSKYEPYSQALFTDLGQVLLRPIFEQMSVIDDARIMNKATEEDNIKYSVLLGIASSWAEKIAVYHKEVLNLERETSQYE